MYLKITSREHISNQIDSTQKITTKDKEISIYNPHYQLQWHLIRVKNEFIVSYKKLKHSVYRTEYVQLNTE